MAEIAILSIGGIIGSYLYYNKIYKNNEIKNENENDIENNNISNLIDICKKDMYEEKQESSLTISERFRLIEYINKEINEIDNSKVLSWIYKYSTTKDLTEMREYLFNPNKYQKNYYYGIR
jgi:hypothetical protein